MIQESIQIVKLREEIRRLKKVITEFTCSECGTKCRVMKEGQDMWIEAKEENNG